MSDDGDEPPEPDASRAPDTEDEPDEEVVNSGLSTPEGLPDFWALDKDDDGFLIRPATDDEVADYAQERLGSADLTRDDLEYLGRASWAIDSALEEELAERGLHYIVMPDGLGYYDPITTGYFWSCE